MTESKVNIDAGLASALKNANIKVDSSNFTKNGKLSPEFFKSEAGKALIKSIATGNQTDPILLEYLNLYTDPSTQEELKKQFLEDFLKTKTEEIKARADKTWKYMLSVATGKSNKIDPRAANTFRRTDQTLGKLNPDEAYNERYSLDIDVTEASNRTCKSFFMSNNDFKFSEDLNGLSKNTYSSIQPIVLNEYMPIYSYTMLERAQNLKNLLGAGTGTDSEGNKTTVANMVSNFFSPALINSGKLIAGDSINGILNTNIKEIAEDPKNFFDTERTVWHKLRNLFPVGIWLNTYEIPYYGDGSDIYLTSESAKDAWQTNTLATANQGIANIMNQLGNFTFDIPVKPVFKLNDMYSGAYNFSTTFYLINDSSDALQKNFAFMQAFFAGTQWYQHALGTIQCPNVYNVLIPGRLNILWAAVGATFTYAGKLRKNNQMAEAWGRNIQSIDADTLWPDAWKVTVSIKSLVPNNLNTQLAYYLGGWSESTVEMLKNTGRENDPNRSKIDSEGIFGSAGNHPFRDSELFGDKDKEGKALKPELKINVKNVEGRMGQFALFSKTNYDNRVAKEDLAHAKDGTNKETILAAAHNAKTAEEIENMRAMQNIHTLNTLKRDEATQFSHITTEQQEITKDDADKLATENAKKLKAADEALKNNPNALNAAYDISKDTSSQIFTSSTHTTISRNLGENAESKEILKSAGVDSAKMQGALRTTAVEFKDANGESQRVIVDTSGLTNITQQKADLALATDGAKVLSAEQQAAIRSGDTAKLTQAYLSASTEQRQFMDREFGTGGLIVSEDSSHSDNLAKQLAITDEAAWQTTIDNYKKNGRAGMDDREIILAQRKAAVARSKMSWREKLMPGYSQQKQAEQFYAQEQARSEKIQKIKADQRLRGLK